MNWFVLVVSTYVLAALLFATIPVHRGPLAMFSFVIGWPAAELAPYALGLEALLAGLLAWRGWPHGVVAVVLTVELVLSAVAGLTAIAASWIARPLARRALRHGGPHSLDEFHPVRDAFGAWWRTVAWWPFSARDILVTRHVPYGPNRRQSLDVMRTSTTPQSAPVLFYVHGGAWTYGDKREQARPMMFEFVRRGWVVVSINYRLAPTHPWPAQIDDTKLALAWVKRTIAAHGGDPDNIVVAGGSAGGHLASLLALTANSDEWRTTTTPPVDLSVKGCISFYGVLEMLGDSTVWRRHEKGLLGLLEGFVMQRALADDTSTYWLSSPLQRVAPDAPPFLVIQGKNDTLVDHSVARHFVSTFRQTVSNPRLWSVTLPLTQHAFDLTPSPRTTATTRAAVAFAEWAVRQDDTYPHVPTELIDAYRVPPTKLEVDEDGTFESATKVSKKRGPFFVVTASNPIGSTSERSAAENDAANERLRAEVAHRGMAFLPSRGSARDGVSWREDGVALFGVRERDARLLARRYRQYAFYEVRDGKAIVRSARDGEVLA